MFGFRLVLTSALRLILIGLILFVVSPTRAEAQSVTLTVHVAGTGTVGVIPLGGLCRAPSTVCTFQVSPGTAIRLVANGIPSQSPPGRFFSGSGAAAGCGLSTCSFTMTAATEVSATFDAANTPTATVTTTLGGDGQGEVGVDNSRCQNFDLQQFNACQTLYMLGSVVTLDARAAAGSRFSGFSGGTAGAGTCGTPSSCAFTLTANATVTGDFKALTSIAVAPSAATRGIGQSQTFVANGTFSDGITEPIPFGSMGTWRTRAPIPATMFGFGATVANGRVYAVGGEDGAGVCPCAIVRVYDPVANTWSTAAPMPTARELAAVVTVNGLIYAIGGDTQGSVPTAAVERYDPATNTWISRAPLPGARRFLAAGVVNGIIYAVGGQTVIGGVTTTVATVEAYDPATNAWTTRAPMLTARNTHGVGVVNGLLYAVGGDSFGTVEAYDPSTNAWTSKASQPTGGNGALAVAVADDVLYAVGGSGAGSAMLQYDAVRDAWNIKSGMPTGRSELGAVAINGTIYALGGIASPNPGPGTNTPLNVVEAFTDHVRWSSSAPAVARVSQQGVMTPAIVGTANIVASVGSLTCGSACGVVTVRVIDAVVSIDKASLQFAATSNGSAFVQQTQNQTVRLTQSGCCTVAWTATPTQPWITVSPASGTGTSTLTIGVTRVASLPGSGGVNGLVNLAFTGATNSSAAIGVGLNIVVNGASTAPAGAFETPLDNAAGLSGSIGITGWAVDDVEVTRVRILRDPVAGEPSGQLVFIGNAVFVDGARPDVAQAFASVPRNTRAGWGYLLLTNFLPNLGNGTYRLHAFADDADGHATLLGTRTITCDNAAATRPFGAIDTPGQGETVSGTISNFGWALARGARRADPPNGGTVVVLVDGVVVGSPFGWVPRSDLAALFPAALYSGVNNALGVFALDTTTLANGVHTIAWIVTDDTNGADGVGSRFFTVSNGSALRLGDPNASQPVQDLAPAVASAAVDRQAIAGRHGYDLEVPLRSYRADRTGRITIDGEELDRFELQLETGTAGFLRSGTDLLPLPIGSRLDAETGVFTWQPGVAFVGPYDLVFVSSGSVDLRREVRIVLHPKGSGHTATEVTIDTPGQGEIVQPFVVAGWAADLDARAGTGVATLHVWAYPVGAAASVAGPIFLGAAAYGGTRPDVADVHGAQYRDSGFGLTVQGLESGTYDLAVFAWSTALQKFAPAKVVRVTVRQRVK